VPIDGQKNFRGRIKIEGDEIVFEDKTSGEVRFPYSAVAKANLEIDLEEELKRSEKRKTEKENNYFPIFPFSFYIFISELKFMTSIGQSIEALCSEQGIDRNLVIEAMKEAVKAAARKQFKTQDKTGDSIQVDWNNEEGTIEISAQKEVVAEVENPSTELSLVEAQELAGDEIEIGDMLLIPLPTEELGRIAAQTAKQILVQKVREAIREKVYEEYIDKKGTN
jgi:hypothetical protein